MLGTLQKVLCTVHITCSMHKYNSFIHHNAEEHYTVKSHYYGRILGPGLGKKVSSVMLKFNFVNKVEMLRIKLTFQD